MNGWICPNCRIGLERQNGVWKCANGHTFDVAREGYVNFLVGRQRTGLGDSAEMLRARRRFLEAGHYAPLRQRLAEMVAGFEHQVIAEFGCGEGYYIGGVFEYISSSKCLAYDVSKEAVKLAAARYKGVDFAVADTNKLVPLPDASVDVALDIFAPRNAAEFRRVVRPGGRLVVVIPAPEHLAELREVAPILGIEAEKRTALEMAFKGRFELVVSEELVVPMELDEGGVRDLIGMMPSARHMTTEGWKGVSGTRVAARFEILTYS